MPIIRGEITETVDIETNGTHNVAQYTSVNVNVQPNISSLNVTPTTSAQTITAPSGTDGYSPVNVSAVTSSIDANITAGNIKKDVTILGVTGSYEGGGGSAPAHYIEKAVDANGKLINTSYFINLIGVTDVGDSVLSYVYRNNTDISGAVDMSTLTKVSGRNACDGMFIGCTGLTGVNLSSLTTVSGYSACSYMFSGCTSLTSVDMPSLTTISGSCAGMFYGCTGLTSVGLSALTTVSGQYACNGMFYNCTSLTSVDMPSLTTISGSGAFDGMFQRCTSLATVYIGGTTAIDFGSYTNQFNGMFNNCTQNIDVYAPAASQSAIEGLTGYPNFGATGTVTWHWRS